MTCVIYRILVWHDRIVFSISSVVKRMAVHSDVLLPPKTGLVILIYHRVGGGSDGPVDLDPFEFSWQMEYLSATGLVVTLDEGLKRIANGDSKPGVVVTFDDGTADFTDIAVPIMVRHGVASLLYAETEPISLGKCNAGGLPPTSWSALRDAVSTGLVTIGSHTHTHRLLHGLDAETARYELDRSIEAIAESIGLPPEHFAYPKAVDGSPAANEEVRQRFRSAALGGGRSNTIGSDPLRLARTPIQCSDSREMFESKVRGGMRLEGALREAVSRFRYRRSER